MYGEERYRSEGKVGRGRKLRDRFFLPDYPSSALSGSSEWTREADTLSTLSSGERPCHGAMAGRIAAHVAALCAQDNPIPRSGSRLGELVTRFASSHHIAF